MMLGSKFNASEVKVSLKEKGTMATLTIVGLGEELRVGLTRVALEELQDRIADELAKWTTRG